MAAIDLNKPATTPTRNAPALLPPGPYLAEIAWVEKTLSQNNKERLTFTYRVVAGSEQGKTYREDCYLSEGSIWKLQTLAKAAGVDKSKPLDPDDAKGVLALFMGKQLKIVLAVDTSNPSGAEGRQISVFESLDPVVKKQMNEERQARFGGKGGGKATTSASTDAGGEEAPF